MRTANIALFAIGAFALTLAQSSEDRRLAERTAIASADHPFAGFWKPYDCTKPWGLAIAPAGSPGLYSVSFCGPGGCFEPGTYRPNTTLVNDASMYWVIDPDTIEVKKCDGTEQATRYVRCPGREVP